MHSRKIELYDLMQLIACVCVQRCWSNRTIKPLYFWKVTNSQSFFCIRISCAIYLNGQRHFCMHSVSFDKIPTNFDVLYWNSECWQNKRKSCKKTCQLHQFLMVAPHCRSTHDGTQRALSAITHLLWLRQNPTACVNISFVVASSLETPYAFTQATESACLHECVCMCVCNTSIRCLCVCERA